MMYFVNLGVDGTSYMAKVEANSAYAAEHYYLDQAECSSFGYGVDFANAYSEDYITTDCFKAALLAATMISNDEVAKKIRARNAKLREYKEAYETIRKNKKMISELQKAIEAAELILKGAK